MLKLASLMLQLRITPLELLARLSEALLLDIRYDHNRRLFSVPDVLLTFLWWNALEQLSGASVGTASRVSHFGGQAVQVVDSLGYAALTEFDLVERARARGLLRTLATGLSCTVAGTFTVVGSA